MTAHLNRKEKRRRRDISRQYVLAHDEEMSLRQYPECDGTWFMCPSCKRYRVGCGAHPFTPITVDMPGATDPVVCDGFF